MLIFIVVFLKIITKLILFVDETFNKLLEILTEFFTNMESWVQSITCVTEENALPMRKVEGILSMKQTEVALSLVYVNTHHIPICICIYIHIYVS